MSQAKPHIVARPVESKELAKAASRLVGAEHGPAGARRFLANARAHGIDPSLMWAAGPGGRSAPIEQVCLAVPSSGRTLVLFVSGPAPGEPPGDVRARSMRAEAVRAACRWAAATPGREIRIIQALPDPDEDWAVQGLQAGGLKRLTRLLYLERVIRSDEQPRQWDATGTGVELVPITDVGRDEAQRGLVLEALDRTYADSRDCPELHTMRLTEDVLDSHAAAGTFRAGWWTVMTSRDSPVGCMLFNQFADRGVIELVYFGLAPEARGRGWGTKLLELGISRFGPSDGSSVTCAVDERNGPARRMYESLGFRAFGGREAMVLPVSDVALD